MTRRYERSLRLAADSTDQLRTSDVYRVLGDASDRGYAIGMAAWLVEQRPDLRDEVDACLEELAI